LIDLLLALLLGLLTGVITGLIPGVHINIVGSLLLSYSLASSFDGLTVAVFVSSLSVAHTFIDFIPGIFLGSPNDDSSMSVLPGHKLLLEGRGFDASVYAMRGCLIGIVALILLLPIIILLMPKVYDYFVNVIWLILITASFYLILSQKNKLIVLLVFLLSGLVGVSTLGLPVNQPLLPLLSGLFGSSTIISSLLERSSIPPQISSQISAWKVSFYDFISTFKAIIISSPVPAFMPGMGSSQAVIIGSSMIDDNPKSFLSLIGGTNVLVMGLSFVAAFLFSKSRTGSAAVVLEFLPNFSSYHLTVIIISFVISGFLSFFAGVFIAKRISLFIGRINYRLLSLAVLIFVSLLVILITGYIGVIIFLTSTAIGLLCSSLGVRKTTLMSSLIIPTIWLYWPF
jgi:putative membrane protein